MKMLNILMAIVTLLFINQIAICQVSDDFESINAWNPAVTNEWTASSTTPIAGTQSLKHNGNGTTSGSTKFSNVSRALPGSMSNLNGSTTTWEFKLKTSGKGVSASQKFWVVLAANGTNVRMPNTSNVVDISVPSANGINGYAIGVNPISSTASARPLKLMRITNSAAADLVTVNGPSYSGNYGTSTAGYNTIGVKVIRSAAASWTVYADFNNDGTYEIVTSPVTDNTHNNSSYVGACLRWPTTATASSTLAGNMYLDNFSITQTTTSATYYSVNNGNMSANTVWSLTAGGSPVTPVFNAGANLIISHNIVIDGNYSLGGVTINAGGTLSSGGATQNLIVSGNWTNNHNSSAFNGNFDPTCCISGCKITFGGTSPQIISGTSGTRFMELQVNNPQGVTLNSPVYITGSVQPTSGTLNTNGAGGSLVLISNSTCSGSISAIGTSADISGPITLQRYIPALSRSSWLFLSCPLYTTAAQTSGFTPITAWGAATVNGITYPAFTFTNNTVNWYNETVGGVINNGYTNVNNSTGIMNPKLGYRVLSSASAKTTNPTGFIIKGAVNVPMTYTPVGEAESWGWNLLTNPYPSEINWDLVEAASSNVGAYFIFDYETNSYLYYNANDGTFNTSPAYPDGIGKYIPHSQSFFVQSTTSGQSINFSESMKTNRCSPKQFERSLSTSLIEMHLLNSEKKTVDASNITSNDNSTNAFDQGWDVSDLYDLQLNPFNLSLLSEEKTMLMASSINSQVNNTIPVYLDLSSSSDISDFAYLQMTNIQDDQVWFLQNNFGSNQIIIFRGNQTIAIKPNEWVQMRKDDQIQISFKKEWHGTAFFLYNCPDGNCPRNEQESVDGSFHLNIQYLNESVMITSKESIIQELKVFNAAGQLIQKMNVQQPFCEINTSSFSSGIYTIQARGDKNQFEITRFVVK